MSFKIAAFSYDFRMEVTNQSGKIITYETILRL